MKNEEAWSMIEDHPLVEHCTNKDALWLHLEAIQKRGHLSQHDIINLEGILTAIKNQPKDE